jgi:hypothetical protein
LIYSKQNIKGRRKLIEQEVGKLLTVSPADRMPPTTQKPGSGYPGIE